MIGGEINSISIAIVLIIISGLRPFGINSYIDSDPSLFKIERSRDADEIFYDVNLNSNGELNTRMPIKIYWIKKTKGGRKEGLTWVQKKFGYGLKYEKISPLEAEFKFVSYLNRSFILKKDKNGVFKVFALYEDSILEVKNLYIQFNGGSFLSPKISKVELYGYNPQTGELVKEKISSG